MGIKPEGTNPVVVPPDNVQTRWGEWEASIDTAGQQAGEVFAETHAIATSANSVAATALSEAQGYITAAENVTAELTAEIDPEHPDYLLWSLANQVDQATQQALRAHSEAISANDMAVQALTRTAALMATVQYGEAYVGEHFVASWNDTTVTIAKRGEWVGEVTVMLTVSSLTSSDGPSASERHTHQYTNHSRSTWLPTDSSRSYTVITGSNVTILYQVKPGTPESKSIDSPELRTLANGVWETLAQWVVPSDTQVSASGSFVWDNKTFLGDYYARLTLDGVTVTTGEVSSGAPIFGHGARTHQVSMRLQSASRNAVLRLEARASHGNSLNRQVRDVNLTTHWVGQGSEDVETVAITGTLADESQNQFRQALADRGLHYSTVTEIPFNIDTSAATNLNSMFDGCSALTSVPDMDTSGVTDMGWMFNGCSSLTHAPALDTSQVTTMGNMFSGCSSLTHVPDMATSSVTDMYAMFSGCSSLTDGNVRLIGRHPQVNTTSMITGSGLTQEPFREVVQITLGPDLEARDQFRAALSARGLDYTTVMEIPFEIELVGTGSVRDMFRDCSSLTSVPAMDTSQVTNMLNMFRECAALTYVPDMYTAQVTNMNAMFYNCAALTDGNVRLIGRHPNVTISNTRGGSGLTRLPFYDAAGNPI